MIELKPITSLDDIDLVDTPQYIFCYRDNLSGAFATPFFTPDEPSKFANAIKAGVQHGKIQEDVMKTQDIYCLGVFHTNTGLFELLDEPKLFVSLKTFIQA